MELGNVEHRGVAHPVQIVNPIERRLCVRTSILRVNSAEPLALILYLGATAVLGNHIFVVF